MWELDCEENWVLENWCFWTVVLEKTLESPLDCKEIQPVPPKGEQSWMFIERTDAETGTLATWCDELTHLKKPWCWEKLKAGGEGDNRGWDGWMASPTWWAWVWASSGSWWWTRKPGMLQSVGLQRVRHSWTTELNTLLYTCTTASLSVPLSVDISSLPVLAIIGSAAVAIGVHVSFSPMVFSGHVPSSEIVGSYGGFIPSFLKNRHTVLYPSCIDLQSTLDHILSSIYL